MAYLSARQTIFAEHLAKYQSRTSIFGWGLYYKTLSLGYKKGYYISVICQGRYIASRYK